MQLTFDISISGCCRRLALSDRCSPSGQAHGEARHTSACHLIDPERRDKKRRRGCRGWSRRSQHSRPRPNSLTALLHAIRLQRLDSRVEPEPRVGLITPYVGVGGCFLRALKTYHRPGPDTLAQTSTQRRPSPRVAWQFRRFWARIRPSAQTQHCHLPSVLFGDRLRQVRVRSYCAERP